MRNSGLIAVTTGTELAAASADLRLTVIVCSAAGDPSGNCLAANGFTRTATITASTGPSVPMTQVSVRSDGNGGPAGVQDELAEMNATAGSSASVSARATDSSTPVAGAEPRLRTTRV